jgi:anti-sigma factor RsiW
MAESGCISEQDLKGFLLGELPEQLADSIVRHLNICPDCEARVGRLDSLSDFAIRALRRVRPQPPTPWPRARPGRPDARSRGGHGALRTTTG